MRLPIVILTAALTATSPALSHDLPATIVIYPTSPAAFVPIAGLPSFLVMPGSPLPTIPAYVVQAVAVPAFSTYAVVPVDLDCAQLPGEVLAPAPDPYNLDRDNDGIGCEPEDR